MTVRTLGKQFKYQVVNAKVVEVHTAIAPEENLHGVLIKSLFNTSIDYVYVYGPVKPLNRDDTTCVRFPRDCVIYNDYFVPAGNGVYFLAPDTYTANLRISWDFLNADGSVA